MTLTTSPCLTFTFVKIVRQLPYWQVVRHLSASKNCPNSLQCCVESVGEKNCSLHRIWHQHRSNIWVLDSPKFFGRGYAGTQSACLSTTCLPPFPPHTHTHTLWLSRAMLTCSDVGGAHPLGQRSQQNAAELITGLCMPGQWSDWDAIWKAAQPQERHFGFFQTPINFIVLIVKITNFRYKVEIFVSLRSLF